MFQTNLRLVDVLLDVDRTADRVQAHGADTWLINAGGIYSFYPTDLAVQTRVPGLARRPGGDLLRDAVGAAHARGMRLLARMDFSKITQEVADANPEFCFVDPQGRRQTYEGLVSTCPSGPYYQERSLEILDEVLGRYPIDGIFCNWFGYSEVDYAGTYRGVCQCSSCQDSFGPQLGGSLPTGPGDETYGAWRTLAAGTVAALTERIRERIKEHRPDAALILGDSSDVVFHEANNAVDRELWTYATSAAVSAAKARDRRIPVLVNAVSFVDMPYRMAGEDPHTMGAYLAQTLARAGTPSTYIMGVPGDIPYTCLNEASRLTRLHRDNAEVYDGLIPAARTAVVRSPAQGRSPEETRTSEAEFRGWYDALTQTHRPIDVLTLPALEAPGALERFAVVVLADVGALTPAAAEAIDAFTEAGGQVVATGSSALAQGQPQLRTSPLVREDAHITDPEALKARYVSAGVDTSTPVDRFLAPTIPVVGRWHQVTWHPEAAADLLEITPASYGPPELAYGQQATGNPGAGTRTTGSGSSTYLPFTAGAAHHIIGTTECRDILIAQLPPSDDDVTLDAPEPVELTVHRGPGRLVVHLVNHSGARRRGYGPAVPVHGARLRLGSGQQPLRALVSGHRLAPGPDGWIDLPTLDLLEVLVTETKENR